MRTLRDSRVLSLEVGLGVVASKGITEYGLCRTWMEDESSERVMDQTQTQTQPRTQTQTQTQTQT